jgi:DNA-binding NarL/FixJ family response regulator
MLMSILVVDDHPVTREGIRLAVCARHARCTVDISDSVVAARHRLRRHQRYDLLLLDYRLPDSSGLSGFFTLRAADSKVPIALLTATESDHLAALAKAVGAVGFLSKLQSLQTIADGIDGLLTGGTVFPADMPDLPDIVALRDRVASLSPAQLQVLVASLNGALNKQIGADLNLSEATIKAHMTAIFRKLGVASRMEAINAVRPIFGDVD